MAVGAPDHSRRQTGSPQTLRSLQQPCESQDFPSRSSLEQRREFYDQISPAKLQSPQLNLSCLILNIHLNFQCVSQYFHICFNKQMMS